jgi:hypothetical protein
MEDTKTPDQCQQSVSLDESELERQRREKDEAWELQEAKRREEITTSSSRPHRDRKLSAWLCPSCSAQAVGRRASIAGLTGSMPWSGSSAAPALRPRHCGPGTAALSPRSRPLVSIT